MMHSTTLMAIGGCHVTGYGITQQTSFVDHLCTALEADCTFKKGYFQLKKVGELGAYIHQHQPHMVLLQLGNFEFHASVKKLLAARNSSRTGSSSGSSSYAASINTANRRLSLLKTVFEGISLPFISRYLLRKNQPYLLELQQQVRNHPEVFFVVLSPIPCMKFSDNYVRKCGGKRMKRLTSTLSNVLFLDLFRSLPFRQDHYFDQAHLNAKGHEALALLITQQLQVSLNPARVEAPIMGTPCLTGA